MPRPPKLSPSSYLRLLKIGEGGKVEGEPIELDEPRATAEHGMRGAVELCVIVRERIVLRIEIDRDYFGRREVAWFIRLVERIAERRRSRIRAV